jgi:hypothetical protein
MSIVLVYTEGVLLEIMNLPLFPYPPHIGAPTICLSLFLLCAAVDFLTIPVKGVYAPIARTDRNWNLCTGYVLSNSTLPGEIRL